MSKSVDDPTLPDRSRPELLTTDTVLPLVEEQLQVTRQQEETGVLRVRVEVRESTETVPTELLTEQVSMRRIPVGRAVAERQAPHQEGDEWVVPVYEEVPVMEMRLVLREEIRIARRTTREPGEQQVRLRREVAVVERRQPDGSWQSEPASVLDGPPDGKAQGTAQPPPAAA